MITGVNVPLEAALLLSIAVGLAGVWIGQFRANRRLDPQPIPRSNPRPNPLGDLLKPEVLAEAIDLAAHRSARRGGAHAVVHGRIDQLAMMRTIWNLETRAEVSQHVAAVMRAGLRRNDRIAINDSDGFTILIPGADERTAVGIADRLRRALAQLHLPQLGGEALLTASFGVASDRVGEGNSKLEQRARRALDAAVAKGEDHVVPASEIEEILLLPAPAPSPTASAA
jgi:diguanylate cyclase (GGDEF)-like protein